MSQINQPPLGLQSFLGSQNFGVNPSNLAQSVIPTVDMIPFMGARQIVYTRTTGGINGVGIPCLLTVPSGEAWYVLTATAEMGGAASAGTYSVALQLSNVPGLIVGARHKIVSSGRETLAIADRMSCTFNPGQPVIWEAGTDIELRVDAAPGLGVESYLLSIQHYRMVT